MKNRLLLRWLCESTADAEHLPLTPLEGLMERGSCLLKTTNVCMFQMSEVSRRIVSELSCW